MLQIILYLSLDVFIFIQNWVQSYVYIMIGSMFCLTNSQEIPENSKTNMALLRKNMTQFSISKFRANLKDRSLQTKADFIRNRPKILVKVSN